MKCYKIILFIIAFSFLLPSCSFFEKENPVGIVSEHLLDLLAELRISHDETLKDIVRVTQKEFLRPAQTERWHLEDKYLSEKEKILPILKRIGLVDEIAPSKKIYDYALLLGSSIVNARKRLAYLIKLFKQGIRFKSIVVLTGQRKLSVSLNEAGLTVKGDERILPLKKGWRFFGKVPETETDIFKIIFDQTDFDPEFGKISVVFIDTPRQRKADGTWRRPNTQDTVHSWLERKPTPGSCLSTSNQPFVLYQDAVIKTILPPEFELETIGYALNPPYNIAVILDSLARFLYQTRLYQTRLYQTCLYQTCLCRVRKNDEKRE